MVNVSEKMLLSVDEAAEYSNIGICKIRELIKQDRCQGFVLKIGNKRLIKRRLFEEFIDKMYEI